jgi:hypothetical protein
VENFVLRVELLVGLTNQRRRKEELNMLIDMLNIYVQMNWDKVLKNTVVCLNNYSLLVENTNTAVPR